MTGSNRPFRFGVHTSDAQTGEANGPTAARRYESLGFSTLLLRDHFDQQLAPIVAMTAAACATETLRVGCLVFANDYRHPLVLAKELATLDRLSGGRVEIGLGAGWMGSDYEQAGLVLRRAARPRVAAGGGGPRDQGASSPAVRSTSRATTTRSPGTRCIPARTAAPSADPDRRRRPAHDPVRRRRSRHRRDQSRRRSRTRRGPSRTSPTRAPRPSIARSRLIRDGGRESLRRDRAPDRRAVRRAHRRPRRNGAGHRRPLPSDDPSLDLTAETVLVEPVRAHRHRGPDLRHPRRAP